ncbi:PIF1-like helicase [Ilyonectria robusta]
MLVRRAFYTLPDLLLRCLQYTNTITDNYYKELDTDELIVEDDKFKLEAYEEPIAEEDWHKLACMLPDRPLEEEDINILGCRDIDINYNWTPYVGRYTVALERKGILRCNGSS